jgi:hypothetical protein
MCRYQQTRMLIEKNNVYAFEKFKIKIKINFTLEKG